jgi:hypothetical protein
METMRDKRVWGDVIQVPKENNCQPRLLYTANLSFKIKGEIKIFYDKHKLCPEIKVYHMTQYQQDSLVIKIGYWVRIKIVDDVLKGEYFERRRITNSWSPID